MYTLPDQSPLSSCDGRHHDGDPLGGRAIAGRLRRRLRFRRSARWHPVAGFGRLALALERPAYAPTRVRGAVFAARARGDGRRSPPRCWRARLRGQGWARLDAAALTWAALGGRSLRREACVCRRAGASGASWRRRAWRCARCAVATPRALDGVGAVPRGGGVARREHERRGRRRAALGRRRRPGRRRRLPRGEHARRDGRAARRALRAVRLGGGPAGRRDELAGRAADGGARLRGARRWSAAPPALQCASCAATAAPTRAPTPGASRRRLPARSACARRTLAYAGRVERPTLGDGRAPGVEDMRRAARLSLAVRRGGRSAPSSRRLLCDRVASLARARLYDHGYQLAWNKPASAHPHPGRGARRSHTPAKPATPATSADATTPATRVAR